MKFIKLDENNIVIQSQPNAQDGFIEAPDSVVCGMVKVGDNYEVPAKTAEEIEAAAIAAIPIIASWQAKAALELTEHPDGGNYLEAAEAALASLPSGLEKIVALSKWNNNSSFDIQSPIIQQLAGAIGIDEAELKQLFQLGASL